MKYFSPTLKAILFIIPLSLIASLAIAQQSTGQVTGKLTDQQNLPVETAEVSLKGTAYHTATTADGSFTLTAPIGHYTLEVSRVGFKLLSKSIDIKTNQATDLGSLKLENTTDVSEVSVKGKTQSQVLRDQGFQVNVIDLKSQYNTSADVNQILNRTTGVRIREEGGLGSNFNFSLNGFTGNQVKFFIDGIPMDNFGASLALNNIPANIVDRVEVYKGVTPVSLGTDALGGAVNIVTRNNPNYLDVSYSYGSFNTHRPAISGAFTNKDGFTVRLNTFYNYSDNNYKVWVPITQFGSGGSSTVGPEQWVPRFHDHYESATAQVEAGVTGKSYADKLLFGLISSENNKDIQTGVTMDKVYGALRSKSSSLIPTLKYTKNNLFTPGLSVNLYSAYNTNRFKLIDTSARIYNWLGQSIPKASGSTGGENSRTQNENKNKEYLANLNFSYRINSWQTLSLNDIYSNFKRTSFDVENPDNYTNFFPSTLVKNTLGLSWNANINDKWISSAFVKYFAMKAVGYQPVNTITDPGKYQSVSFNYTHLGYGLATAYFINPSLQVKASYEHAYRMPDSDEIFGDGVFVIYSPGLKPERSDNVNLGARYNTTIDDIHRFTAEAGGIYRDTKDFIRVDQSTSGGNRQTLNQGRVRTTGAEAELGYSYNNQFFVSVNGTYQNIVDKEEFQNNNGFGGGVTKNFTYNYRLPNLPYLFANANAGYNIPVKDNKLSINYSLNFVQQYYLTFSELGSTETNSQYIIPRQFAHNAYVTYSLDKGKYNVSLECRNILDNRLYDSYRLQKPGRSFAVKLRYYISKN